MPTSMLTTSKSRQPIPKSAKVAVPRGLAPTTKGQAGPRPKKLGALKNRGVPKKSASASKMPSFGSAGIPGATDITPPSPIGDIGGSAPGGMPSFTAPPRPMNMPNMGLGNQARGRVGAGAAPLPQPSRLPPGRTLGPQGVTAAPTTPPPPQPLPRTPAFSRPPAFPTPKPSGAGHASNAKNPKGTGSAQRATGVGAGHMSEAKDRKLDKQQGIKQGSKKDNALDRKRGVPVRKGK